MSRCAANMQRPFRERARSATVLRWGVVLAGIAIGSACSTDVVRMANGSPSDAVVPVDVQQTPLDHRDEGNSDLSPGPIPEDIQSPAPDIYEVTQDPDIIADPPGTWRSQLYPVEWTPDFEDAEGRFVHDFSYAGYRNGEEAPSLPETAQVLDVIEDFGADSEGEADCTESIQAAIDAAGATGGGVVFLPAGLYRVDGVLRVERSGVVLRGEGPQQSRIFFTQNDNLDYAAHLTFKGALTETAETGLVQDAESRQSFVEVETVAGFAVGDDVQVGWIISPDFVRDHDMEFVWTVFNDSWKPFFHRTIAALDADSDPPRILLDVPLRYAARIRDNASVRKVEGYLEWVGIEDLAMGNATDWSAAWANSQVHLIEMTGLKDSWVRNVWSFSPPTAPSSGQGKGAHLQSGGLIVKMSKRVTVADTRLSYAQNRGSGGCGYLFEVRQSSEILFRDCEGRAGRHNFIQNWGFGATGIVWLRVHSLEGENIPSENLGFGLPAYSEFHHSLATANLIDSSVIDDGWSAVNRGDWSSGAGHTATENVFWNNQGAGMIRSLQYGWGYVIGTRGALLVSTTLPQLSSSGTDPEDHTEGLGEGDTLYPPSLYEDQLIRRLGPFEGL